ncbi:MAG TPA: WbqC family protein [Bdellovibrionota bacterium]|nr:WbqC family protein [Bdellovibrionota bacterium]
MMRVVVLQSNYLPWKGYFDLIHDCDLFVFYDEVQYTKNDWRNRNRIYTKNGLQWLTIPVARESVHFKISEVALPGGDWAERHWKALTSGYGRAPHFEQLEALMRPPLLERRWERLSELNQHLVREIASRLGIRTRMVDSSEYRLEPGRVDRLLSLLKQAGATQYVSGPAAREYLAASERQFAESGITVSYKDYTGYPEYPQLRAPFEHAVSILDLVANVAWDRIPDYVWRHRESARG